MSFLQPHYVPDNYKRNGGRSAWKSERPKGCDDDGSSCDRGDDFPPEGEDGRGMDEDMDMALEDPEVLTTKPRTAERGGERDEEEDEEDEEEAREGEERKELEEGSTERMGEMLELPSSSASSPLHHPVLGRREAQRERLNKILLDLLHRTPSKNGEGAGTKQGGRSTDEQGFTFTSPVLHICLTCFSSFCMACLTEVTVKKEDIHLLSPFLFVLTSF